MLLNAINIHLDVLQKFEDIMHNDAATEAALVFVLLQKETLYITINHQIMNLMTMQLWLSPAT